MTEKMWQYIVWVGSTPNYFIHQPNAFQFFLDWCYKGYDDIVMTKIISYEIKNDTFQETEEETMHTSKMFNKEGVVYAK